MGILSDIKKTAAKSGANKGKIIYFREGQKTRIRFLTDMDDGMKIMFHDSFEKSINVPCQEVFGRDCPYCGDEDLRTRAQYIWSVYDVENKDVKILMAPVNNCSPVTAMVGMYEAYETLVDRDYIITRNGKGQNTTYSVVPLDKSKFRDAKAKPYSESAILKILDKAFPPDSVDDNDEDEEEDEEETRAMKKKNKSKIKPKTKKRYEEEDEDDEFEDDDQDDSEDAGADEDDEEDIDLDYEEMSRIDLYNLCKERRINCEKKKSANYYIKLLRKFDKNEEDWEDDE